MRATTTRVAAVDEANLVLDHDGQVNVFLAAGLLEPGGFVAPDGQPDVAALRVAAQVAVQDLSALRRVPVPFGRRHRWTEKWPDLEHHVRLVAPVKGLAGLEQACSALMTVPIDLDRPLWELLIVPGASERSVGFVLRIHHAIADGAAAVAIVHSLFGHTASELVSESLSDVPAAATPQAAAAPQGTRGPRRLIRKAMFGLRRILTTVFGPGVGPTVLLGARSESHGVAFLDADIRALKTHVRKYGATVNDGLLAAAAAGYTALLSAAGESTPVEIPVSIPVALRRRGASGNQVGVMLIRLPLHISDPEKRLALIAAQTRPEKVRAREQGTLEFMRGPRGARLMDRIARRQRLVAGFVTNVRGPSGQMTLAGAPVAAFWPVAVLAANVRLGVAAASYDNRLWCSVHFDETFVPGAVFARAMSDEFARLTG